MFHLTLRSALIAALLIASLSLAAPVRAAGVVGDGTPGSCTEAALNTALAGGGTVTFNCGGPKTILVLNAKTIATNTTIDGGDVITLTGGLTTRLFNVNPGATLTLRHIVLDSAFSTGSDGGAISNHGTLNLDHVAIQFSQTDINHSGGAIFTDGPATIVDSTFHNNIGGSAGAIFANFGNAHVTLVNSILYYNEALNTTTGYGGAIWVGNDAHVTVRDGQFFGNMAYVGGALYTSLTGRVTLEGTPTGSIYSSPLSLISKHSTKDGGGIYNQNDGTVTLANSILGGNSAQTGGGIYNLGTLTLTNATLVGNSAAEGGGINTFGGTLILNKVTLVSNSATYGAGIYTFLGAHTLTNVTLSGNTAQSNGGGIYNSSAALTLINVTFAGNSGGMGLTGGIVNAGGGPDPHLHLKNVILAAGSSGSNCAFVVPPDSSEFNLSSDNSCNFGGSRDGVDLLLGPLADNGGPTRTHLPLAGSPALDNGTNAGCPTTDQRGQPRPANGTCDVGAVERQVVVYLPLILR